MEEIENEQYAEAYRQAMLKHPSLRTISKNSRPVQHQVVRSAGIFSRLINGIFFFFLLSLLLVISYWIYSWAVEIGIQLFLKLLEVLRSAYAGLRVHIAIYRERIGRKYNDLRYNWVVDGTRLKYWELCSFLNDNKVVLLLGAIVLTWVAVWVNHMNETSNLSIPWAHLSKYQEVPDSLYQNLDKFRPRNPFDSNSHYVPEEEEMVESIETLEEPVYRWEDHPKFEELDDHQAAESEGNVIPEPEGDYQFEPTVPTQEKAESLNSLEIELPPTAAQIIAPPALEELMSSESIEVTAPAQEDTIAPEGRQVIPAEPIDIIEPPGKNFSPPEANQAVTAPAQRDVNHPNLEKIILPKPGKETTPKPKKASAPQKSLLSKLQAWLGKSYRALPGMPRIIPTRARFGRLPSPPRLRELFRARSRATLPAVPALVSTIPSEPAPEESHRAESESAESRLYETQDLTPESPNSNESAYSFHEQAHARPSPGSHIKVISGVRQEVKGNFFCVACQQWHCCSKPY